MCVQQDEIIITYHTTQEDADLGANALASPYTIFDQITLFVREEVQNNDPLVTACFISNVNFTLTVEPRPEFVAPIPLIVCDDDGVLDGLTTIDISSICKFLSSLFQKMATPWYGAIL